MLVNWLLSRLQCEANGEIEVQHLYASYTFEYTESGNKENVASIHTFIDHLKHLFPNVKKTRKRVKGNDLTFYQGITLTHLPKLNEQDIQFSEIPVLKPYYFDVKSRSEKTISFQMESQCKSNGNCVLKTLHFNNDGTYELFVAGVKVYLNTINIEATYQLNKNSVLSVFFSVEKVNMCNGVKYKKGHVVSRFHTLDMWTYNVDTFRSIRHVTCSKVVPYNSKTLTCRQCQKLSVMAKKENKNIPNETVHVVDENSKKNDNLKMLFPNAPTEMIQLLLEQSNNVSKHPNGRRWSKKCIVTCLQLFNRSPKCYEMLIESKMLILPSKSVLIMYRNALKQEPGFDPNIFEWMHEEASRRGLEEKDRLGGIIFDEMSIQQDIQIEKNGNVLELNGFTELGEEGDMCHQLRKGSTNKSLGTHILQLLFLGLNGFRFPFAFFVTNNVTASELYGLFWKAVSYLHKFGFTVLYTCMDGAQCNRSFMNICISDSLNNFIAKSPCTLKSVVFMMDISHGFKKIRNNMLKSGIHQKCTRILTLPNKFEIHWQMFVDFFRWEQQNGLQLHRKLTNDHLFPDSQLKMRNYLAEDMLNLEMLHSIKIYQNSLGEKGIVLNGLIELLEHTSKLIKIFRDMKPIKELNDHRLQELKIVDEWFNNWENGIEKSSLPKKEKAKCLMSPQCHQDIHAGILGFIELCEMVLQRNTNLYITPGLINSDVIENIFNQQRSTYNGANSNPSLLQYKKTINNIIIGQNIVSKKANAGQTAQAAPFTVSVNRPLQKRKTTSSVHDSQCKSVKKIKAIRM